MVLSAMYEQPELLIADPEPFGAVRSAISDSFSTGKVAAFLKSVERAGVRIRDFQGVVSKGLLGATTAGEYSRLGDSDQGQIREFYLASLEKVSPDLRRKFFRLYAYY